MYQTNNLSNNQNNYIYKQDDKKKSNCLHENCPRCNGTGISNLGGVCIHNIACNCPKCSVR